MRKRLLSGLLALCMVVSLLSVTVWAEPTDAAAAKIREDAENIIWGAEHPVDIAYSTYGGVVGSYCTASGRVRLDLTSVWLGIPDESWSGVAETPTSFNIPVQVDGLSVTDLGAVDIFYEASNLFHFAKVETVTVPEGVKYLHGSFAVVPNLKAVVLPASLIYIGGNAFASCTALASINFPNNLAYIAEDAFSGCASLQSIDFPESLLYIGPRAFSDCMALQRVTIPKNVGQIESGAFVDCPNLTIYCYTNSCAHQYAVEHNIPFVLLDGEPEESDTAQILGLSPQAGTKGVNYGAGNPPVFEITFDRPITSIETIAGTFSIYHASDDELLYSSHSADDFQFSGNTLTVTPDIQLKPETKYYITLEGAAIRFEDDAINPAIVKDQWQFETASTELDLLALSLLSYMKPTTEPKNKSIRKLIDDQEDKYWDGYWDEDWEKVGIRNNELFADLADWKVYAYRTDESTGFAAYAFYNDSNEFVIAYRGSEISWKDWVENDIWMFFGGEGSQLDIAMKFYNSVATESGSNNITVTGHSLGGGLADIIAARYGCRGESFNSAQFLDVAYWYHPEEMSALFEGTDAFNFKAHANESDQFVGNNQGECIKPLWLYEDNGLVSGLFGAHSLASIVTKDTDGTLKLTKFISQRSPSVVSQKVSVFRNNKVVLGTTTSNNLKYSEYSLVGTNLYWNYAVYGGAGADNIITSPTGDTISGGKGNDTIDGGWGGDTYIYYKGHGADTIVDTSGHDKLLLLGFSASDLIHVEEGDDTHAYVTVNGSTIVKIAKRRSNPVTGLNNSFTVSSNQGFEQNIESYLKDKKSFFERLQFSCPVNVEIINDATGKVVYTLYDQIEVTDYTDYGNFYVFEQEDGEYVKIADLIEGYSARVVGVGGGTMDVVVLDTDGFNLSEPYTAQDVPVTKDMIAIVEEDGNGGKNLVIDTDADGQPDLTVPLITSTDASTTYTVSVSASPTEGGSVTGGGSYDENTSVTVKAVANSGYHFVRWTEGGTTASNDATYTFEVTANRTLTAVFEATSEPPTPTKYTVSVSASPAGGGSVTGGGTYEEGQSVTVKAVANSGYRFVRWTEDGAEVSTDASYTFTIKADRTLTAVFTRTGGGGGGSSSTPSYQITVPTTSNGTVTVTLTSAKSGTKITITATPNDGYTVNSVTVTNSSGNSVSVTNNGDGTYTFTMPASAVTVTVTFKAVEYSITISNTTGGTVISNAITAKKGDTVTLTSKVNAGYISAAPTVKDKDGNTVTVVKNANGTYSFTMPEGSVTVTGSYMTPAQMFSDVDDSKWYRNDLAFAVEHGLISGYNGKFDPSTALTRGMMVTLLYNLEVSLEGKPTAPSATFNDVQAGQYYTDAVAWASYNGIVEGYNNSFNPNGVLDRQQMATILYNYAVYKGYSVGGAADLSGYTDAGSIASWALAGMRWANSAGIVTGSNSALNPTGTSDRTQGAVLLAKFCREVVGIE